MISIDYKPFFGIRQLPELNVAVARIQKRFSVDSGNPRILATKRQNTAIEMFLPGEELEQEFTCTSATDMLK